MKTGDKVTWIHTMKGGYGYIEYIPAIIKSIKNEYAIIKVRKINGQIVDRRVKIDNLKTRNENYEELIDKEI